MHFPNGLSRAAKADRRTTPDSLACRWPAPIVRPNPNGAEMPFFSMIFSWWKSATYGTLMTTWFSGEAVGTDEFGNRYYQTKDGKRRWVLYNGTVEASRVGA